VFDRWSQAVVWDVEIDERAAHEDPGSMNLLVESVLAIYEENVESLPGKESSTLKPGKSRTDDRDVIKRSHAGMLSCRRECRQVLYATNSFVVFLVPFCGLYGVNSDVSTAPLNTAEIFNTFRLALSIQTVCLSESSSAAIISSL
jgi:hypothetical protein